MANNSTFLYLAAATSPESLSAVAQRTIAAWASASKNRDVQAALMRRTDLCDDVRDALSKVRNAKVAVAWAETWFRPGVDDLTGETRIDVLATIAAYRRLDQAIYKQCADRNHQRIARVLVLNPDVDAVTRHKAVKTLVTGQRSIESLEVLERVFVEHPDTIEVAADITDIPQVAELILGSPGAYLHGSAAANVVSTLLYPLLTSGDTWQIRSMLGRRGPGHMLEAALYDGVLPPKVGVPHISSLKALTNRTRRESDQWSLQPLIESIAAAGRQERPKLAKLAHNAMVSTDPTAIVDLLKEFGSQHRSGMRLPRVGMRLPQVAALASPACTPDLVDEALGSHFGYYLLARHEREIVCATLTHFDAGRGDVAAHILAKIVHNTNYPIWERVAERVTGPEVAALASKMTYIAISARSFTSALAFWRVSDLDVEALLRAVPANDLATFVKDPAVAAGLSSYLSSRLGNDPALWERFNMLTNVSFHGSITTMVDTVKGMTALEVV